MPEGRQVKRASTGIGEVRYSLKELQDAARDERTQSALAREQIDSLEIDSVFRKHKRKRSRRDDRDSGTAGGGAGRFAELLEVASPPIPEENRKLIEDAVATNSFEGLEEAYRKELISKKQAGELWSVHIGHAYVDPFESVVTREAVLMVPEEIARKARIVPLYVIDGVLTYGTHNPRDKAQSRRIEQIIDCRVSTVFIFPSDIDDALNIHYASEDEISRRIFEFERQHGDLLESISDIELSQLSGETSVVRIVEALVHFAIRERASDIHLEPVEAASRVRFRVDGRLRQVCAVSRAIYPALVSRLKVLCNANITESRFPQDGRFEMRLGSRRAEFRVSFLPTRYGTKVVIRILAGSGGGKIMSLDEMLMSQSVLKPWRRVIHNPNGIVFVTGPTGSGKTTTLYASLQELNAPDVNISTIEDPIEIQLPGLNQSQINSHIDLSFAILLRALLRQDPDIILVGEIRDLETAKIATEAALTGHLVFSTLHTNTAVQAVVRLLEIGIAPYMVAPSIQAVLAQRLLARLDEAYKESYVPSREELEAFFHDVDTVEDILFYRPRRNLPNPHIGFSGRVAIHELVLVSDEMRSLISANAGARELTQAARKLGYQPLRYDGLKKALIGLTTLSEVERSTPLEWGTER